MKTFFIRLAVFLIPVALFFCIVDHIISKPPNYFIEKRSMFERQQNDLEVLICGPSFTLHGIDPQKLSHKGFNLSNPNQTLYYDIRMVRKYIDKMPRLKLVILSVDYSSLHTQLRETGEPWREYLYLRYWGIKSKDMSYLDIPLYEYTILNWIKGQKIDREKNRGKKPMYTPNELGYVAVDTVGHLQHIYDSSGKESAQTLTGSILRSDDESYIYNDLADFIAFLNDKKVRIVFVTPPVYKSFSNYVDAGIVAGNHSEVEKLCLKYNCKYFDYFTDDRFQVNDFSDAKHLDYLGAAKWSGIIDSEIVKPLLN